MSQALEPGTGGFWNPALLMTGPAPIQSQNVSQSMQVDPSLTFAGWFPTTIPVEPGTFTPTFRTETQQIDLFRILMIVVGVVIGAKLLR